MPCTAFGVVSFVYFSYFAEVIRYVLAKNMGCLFAFDFGICS